MTSQTVVYEKEPVEVVQEPVEVIVEVEIEWTPERIEREIRATFPESPDLAVAIAKAESGLRAKAYNPEAHKNRHGDVICNGSIGIMQIGCVHNRKDKEALYDIKFNLEIARKIYDDSKARTGNGWLPWGAYTSNAYMNYL